jgi:hypothetical protein
MQKRTLLLFALFVVTAWFYASLANDSTEIVVDRHQKQVQMLQEAEEVLSGRVQDDAEQDQG